MSLVKFKIGMCLWKAKRLVKRVYPRGFKLTKKITTRCHSLAVQHFAVLRCQYFSGCKIRTSLFSGCCWLDLLGLCIWLELLVNGLVVVIGFCS